MVSIGTGTKDDKTSGQDAPHFRNVFRDGFARRALDAWLYSLDGEVKWKDLMNLLSDDEKSDHIRYNVSLKDLAGKIDSVSDIDSYRNLVILNPGSAKMAAEVATALLISSFYFELAEVPNSEDGHFPCRDIIRCRPRIRSILPPLEELHGSQQMSFTTDSELLGPFLGEGDVCPSCDRYHKPVSFYVRHLEERISIYLKFGRRKHRKISGFPCTINDIIKDQGLASAFGNSHHDRPGTRPCLRCDRAADEQQCRRKRTLSEPCQDAPLRKTRRLG